MEQVRVECCPNCDELVAMTVPPRANVPALPERCPYCQVLRQDVSHTSRAQNLRDELLGRTIGTYDD